MANARLKQARRRASSRHSDAAQTEENHAVQMPAASISPPTALGSQNEPIADARRERSALEAALLERKRAVETAIKALTLGKTLHKEPEPACDAAGRGLARCHRDFLLQEMEWMAADFAQERKWRVRTAKLLSQTLVLHRNRQEQRLVRQQKREETARRRTAARVGREVKKFWTKINQIIAFKVKLQAEEVRQRHMQHQLKQLVAQTAEYATALAASFQEAQASNAIEPTDEAKTSQWIARDDDRRGEVALIALQKREDLKAPLVQDNRLLLETREAKSRNRATLDEAMYSSEDEAFEWTGEEADDETTIALEEERSGPMSRRQAAAEVAALQQDNEMSIDELRAQYALAAGDDETEARDESGGDDETREEDAVSTVHDIVEKVEDETTIKEEEEQNEEEVSIAQTAVEWRLLNEEGNIQLQSRYADDDATSKLQNIDVESAGRMQGCGRAALKTISSKLRKSGYKRPFLLTSRLELREYQEAGVNWLLSMCERRINGILADEMGLGKTIQTISLLAHLACAQGLWGPHLIVVPTSCLVNWEMEFKRWCPAFKVLTYFGSAKLRKELRQGWSKLNAFQVCITSYQLVVQDAHCFKRKKWYYLILDEAHNIKNWKSLRWQTLLTFSSQRRLLLTGTPVQNNLLELWALMHFLMPHVFASRKEFSYWFQNPLALMVEHGKAPTPSGDHGVEGGNDLVAQLHGIIRPFVLRRLKKDVAKQLPGKFEHVITCPLSKRQRFLYEDFISRSATRRAMFGRSNGRGANFMSMMNVLMQLRKVCNHPDLFEPRPIASPFDMRRLHVRVPSRCGFLTHELVNERPRVALWTGANFPGLELLCRDKGSSQRRRELLYYDVHLPLPVDLITSAPPTFKTKTDIVHRLKALAAKQREYWAQKRARVSHLHSLHAGLDLDKPVFGDVLIQACTMPTFISLAMQVHKHRARSFLDAREPTQALQALVRDPEERLASLQPVVNKSMCYVPKARAQPVRVLYGGRGFARNKFAVSRIAQAEALESKNVMPAARRLLAPYDESFKRTQLVFPEKALVQFDCGKLQQLARLLRTLKRGGHRCLLFTQMSSMLNILEVFLNLHGHTYFRLDGATRVEKRQMLMERFNRDDKIFCFILSTRSGGLGINLTGADAVIFYDSDWNPAMDAQAQDRAHRIGQTRDVHIYRLVSEHTVEENILRKAQQKRQLDFLVMSEGQFTTEFFSKASLRELMTGSTGEHEEIMVGLKDHDTDEAMEDENEVTLDAVETAMAQLEDEEDVVAMKGARAEYMQELTEFDDDASSASNVASPRPSAQTAQARELRPSTPSSVISEESAASERDDEDDDECSMAKDKRGEDWKSTPIERARRRNDRTTSVGSEHDASMDEDNGDQRKIKSRRKRQRSGTIDQKTCRKRPRLSESQHGDRVREIARDAAEEQKLQAWKASVQSLQGFEDSLNPVDRYALHFREDVEPLYACTPAQQAIALAGVKADPMAPTLVQDIEQITVEKRQEEARLIAEGELVVGQMDEELSPEDIAEQYTELYRRERAHVLVENRKRLLTGDAWVLMKCANTSQPFYFNRDTREATWACPPVWVANEQLQSARQRGYEGLPPRALQCVLSMLTPFPERHGAQMVCHSWHTAAHDPSLFVKVSPCDFEPGSPASLVQVLAHAAPGETLWFGAGVYLLTEPLRISTSVRLLAAPDAHVELQMHSCRAHVRWSARGGVIRGFYFTRTTSGPDAAALAIDVSSDEVAATPAGRDSRRAWRRQDKKLANWQHLLRVVGQGQVRVEYCEFNGHGLGNACVCVWGREGKQRRKKKRKRLDRESETRLVSTLQPLAHLVGPSATSVATPLTLPTQAIVSTCGGAMGTSGALETTSTVQATTAATASLTRVPSAVPATVATLSQRPTASVPPSTITRMLAPTHPTPVNTSTMSTKEDTSRPLRSASSTLPHGAGAFSSASTSTAPATSLVLQNCRIRGAGSSGVLLVRGSLIMVLNTVEDNAHSGVTVLGGHALLRRNKIQRNTRFGVRLLYHAGNVILEDNVVLTNACGNLDVDNSGRRFVVRFNNMGKPKTTLDPLPHAHGTYRLKTFRVLEKELPFVPKPVVTNGMSATSEDWKRPLTGSSPSLVSSTLSAVPQARPVAVARHVMDARFPMGFWPPGALAQGSHALRVPPLPMAFALVRAKPTIPSMTLHRARPDACGPGGTNQTLYGSVTLPGTTIESTTMTVATASGPSRLEKQRKRQRQTQQLVEGGCEMILCDSCEMPMEKEVKVRRSKEPLALVPTSSSPALSLSLKSVAAVAGALEGMTATAGNSHADPLAKTPTQTREVPALGVEHALAAKPGMTATPTPGATVALPPHSKASSVEPTTTTIIAATASATRDSLTSAIATAPVLKARDISVNSPDVKATMR